MTNIDPFTGCTLVNDISHDNDLCHVTQIRYLSARQVRHPDKNLEFKPLGMAAFRFLMEFPDYIPFINEKIVFSGVWLRDNKGSPLLYHPAILIESEGKNKVAVKKSYLLEICMATEYYQVATL
jgi:hypothetical protein